MKSSMQLTAAVKSAARDCGASAVRIAAADPDPATRSRFGAAVARGDLATWPYDDAYAGANRKRIVDRWIAEVLP